MAKRYIFIIFFGLFLWPFLACATQIDVNTASLTQLEELDGIGPVKAQAIIDSRPYSSVDDLDRAKGIGSATLAKIKTQGFACVNCSQATQTPVVQNNPEPTPVVSQAPQPETQLQIKPATAYPTGIFINEILPNPTGADETEEWFELYNSNNTETDISNWQVKDSAGTITIYTIPTGTKILANGFLVFKRPDTKIMLNNDEDGLNLYSPDNKLEDSASFSKAPLGQSYNKTNNGWLWSANLTPGAVNMVTTAAVIKKNPQQGLAALSAPIGLPKKQNSVKNDSVSLNQDIKQKNPWFLFFTVLASTIVLAVIALLVKIRILNNHVRT